MQSKTTRYVKMDDKKHSVVFKPAGDPKAAIATSVYVSRDALPPGVITELKLTMSWPTSMDDQDYNQLGNSDTPAAS